MDLYGKYKIDINLLQRLQSKSDEAKFKATIVNTQKCLYDLKIAEINKKVQRLEERNKELEDNLKSTSYFIKILQEEKKQEILDLKLQTAFYINKIKEYKRQLIILEKARIDDKLTHTTRAIKINKKYKNVRFILTSQIKLLIAKTNVLEDYKAIQYNLEKKLDLRNQSLKNEKKQITENLYKIERKFWIHRERFKNELYFHLLDLTSIFQFEISKYLPQFIPNLLSENIFVKNQLSMIMENTSSKTQSHNLHTNAVKECKRKIDNMHLCTIQATVISNLEKSIIAMLHDICKKANINLAKLIKFHYFTEKQCTTNKDNAEILERKCETHVKHVELLLYCEKEKLATASNQKRSISNQLQEYSQILHNVTYALRNLKPPVHSAAILD